MFFKMREQVADLRTFTEKTERRVSPAQPTGDEIATLRSRLGSFRDAVVKSTPASLALSVADLNHLLATTEGPNAMRDHTRIDAITDVIKFSVSLALNGPPFSGERFFLNGTLAARPERNVKHGIILQTKAVEVPGRTPSEGFTRLYLEANHLDGLLLEKLREDGANHVAETMRKVTAIRLEPGFVHLDYAP
jgi:hypothetical protein